MQPLRLLVIDDTEDDFLLACRALEVGGLVADGRRVDQLERLEVALEERRWDLCLLDWVLPELTTPEALRVLRASRQPNLPFIVWSGRDDAKVEFIATEVLGAVGFLSKAQMARLPEMARKALLVGAVGRVT